MSHKLKLFRDAAENFYTPYILLLLSWFSLAGSTGYFAHTLALGHWVTVATPISIACLMLALLTSAYQQENLALGLIVAGSTLLGHFMTSSLGYPGMHLGGLWYAAAGSAAGFWALAQWNDWGYDPWTYVVRFRRVGWCSLFAVPAAILAVFGYSWPEIILALAGIIVIFFTVISTYEDGKRAYAPTA